MKIRDLSKEFSQRLGLPLATVELFMGPSNPTFLHFVQIRGGLDAEIPDTLVAELLALCMEKMQTGHSAELTRVATLGKANMANRAIKN